MKKGIILLVFVFALFWQQPLRAQYVTIPDAGFAYWIDSNFPGSMVGNQLDTTFPTVISATKAVIPNLSIKDLDGIQYFDNLISLRVERGEFSSLPTLPSGLEVLLFNRQDSLSTLNGLPNTLRSLSLYNCPNLTNLPAALPTSLNYLELRQLPLDSLRPSLSGLDTLRLKGLNTSFKLPVIPNSLRWLELSDMQMTPVFYGQLPDSLGVLSLKNIDLSTNGGLPPLPDKLVYISVLNAGLTSLPSPLPSGLVDLYCTDNQITGLPAFPPTLYRLFCSNNQLTGLPAFPSGMYHIECANNQISVMPALPPSLTFFNMSDNQVSVTPVFPNTLRQMDISRNPIDSLGWLPYITSQLYCNNMTGSNGGLKHITNLPRNLIILECNNNSLTELPGLDTLIYLGRLNCSNNQLQDVTYGNDIIYDWNISNNPISCLPYFKTINHALDYTNTNVQCVPNYPQTSSTVTPAYGTLPICDPYYNPNSCSYYWNVSGYTFNDDVVTNCTRDTEPGYANLKLSFLKDTSYDQHIFTAVDGGYTFAVQNNNWGTYNVAIDTTELPFDVCNPTGGYLISSNQVLFSDQNFALTCKTGFDVGFFGASSQTPFFRPARVAGVDLKIGDKAALYNASCATGVSGTVTLVINGPATFVSMGTGALGPSSVSADNKVVVWSIADFSAVSIDSSFNLYVVVDTLAQANQQVCLDLTVTPTVGDNYPANNTGQFCFNVANSYDPNIKSVSPVADFYQADEWLYYTVQFQNTGNAPAIDIFIRDTLDTDLDLSTFELLATSHDGRTLLKNDGSVEFRFLDIYLPDSTSNEPESHGYVQYRVKMLFGKPLGTVIENTAHIYFDFNPAIVTNTTQNTYTQLMGGSSLLFTVYPTATTCGLDNGSIVVTVTSGSGGYQYSLDGSNWQASNTFTGLAAGPYAVIVRDNSTQQISQASVVGASSGVVVDSVTAVEDTCSRSIGMLTVHASGGVGSMQYSINGGTNWQSSPVFTGLFSGYTYQIDVRDNTGCTAVATGLQTGSYNGQVHNFNVTSTNTSCGFQNGTIAFHPPAGAGPFEYSVFTNVWVTDTLFENLPAGSYDCRVRYPFGCAAMLPQFIQIRSSLPIDTFATTVYNATCGLDNAVLAYTAYNGLGKISLDSGQTFLQPYVYNLAPGNYNYIVRDPWGCLSNLVPITIPADPAVHIDSVLVTDQYTCGPNGGIDIYVSGIPGPYTYRILDGISIDSSTTSMDANFTYTAPYSGNYTVLVSDSTGCTDTLSNLAITTLIGLVADSAVVTNTTCGNSNGTATVYARSLNGNPIAVYLLRDSAALFPSLDTSYTGQYTNLAAGTYYVDIYDTMGCGTSITVRIADVSVTDLTSETQTICQGDSYGGYTATGVYVDTLTSSQGCDSIRTLDLTVLPYITNSVTASICSGGNYQGYTAAGTYIDTFTTTGCDSIRTLNLTVLLADTIYEAITICQGESYNGHDISGIYVNTYTNAAGCDSTFIFDLTVNSAQLSADSVSIISGDSLYLGGAWQTMAGSYADTLTDASGCDSVVITELTILVGIPVVSTVDFNIYPNPTTGAVTLQLSTVQPTKVSITNTLGQQIYQAEVTGTETLLDLQLQSGVYFVVVETEQGRGVKKLVVE